MKTNDGTISVPEGSVGWKVFAWEQASIRPETSAVREIIMRVLFATTSAAVLAMMVGAAPAGALTLSAPATMRGAVTPLDGAQNVARVCRDVCNDMGLCRRRCWNEPGYRAYDDDEAPPRVYYDRRRVYEGPPPGVGIYGPGIGIELGPRW